MKAVWTLRDILTPAALFTWNLSGWNCPHHRVFPLNIFCIFNRAWRHRNICSFTLSPSKSWLLIVIHNRHHKCTDPESSFTMNQTRTRALSAGCMKMLNKFIRIELYADLPHQVNKKIVSIELINQSGGNIKRALCMLRYAAFGYHRPSSSLRQGRAFIRTVSESVCSHSGITLIIREVAIQESPPFRSGIHTTSITTLRSHWYRSAGRMVNHDFHHVTQITIKKKLILPPGFYRLPVDNSFWGLYPCSFRILIYTALTQKDYILIYSHYQPHIQNHIPDWFFLNKIRNASHLRYFKVFLSLPNQYSELLWITRISH